MRRYVNPPPHRSGYALAMRSWFVASCALLACNSGNLVGGQDAAVDDAAPDVVLPIDATIDVADSGVDVVTADVVIEASVDAPPEIGPPPLWWEQTTNGHYGAGFALDSNLNVLVGGGSPFYLEKFDAIGNPIWIKYAYGQTNGTYGGVTSLAFDATGAMIVAASLYGTVDVGGGSISVTQGQQTYFVKYDASGNYVWQLGPFPISIYSMAVDAQNGIFACGSLDGSTNLGLGSIAPSGEPDALVLRIGSSGAVSAAKAYGDSAIQRVQACVVDASGGVAMIGSFEGSADFGGGTLMGAPAGAFSNTGGANVFIARLDSSLAYQHAIAFDGTEALGSAIAIDGSGNVLFGGNTRTSINLGGGTLTSTGNYGAIAGALTSSLTYSWGKLFDNSGGVTSVAIDDTGAALWAGAFSQSIDLGCGKQTSNYGTFFARFDSKGACLSNSFATNAAVNGMAFMEKSDWAVGGYVQGTATFPGLPSFTGCNNCTYDGYAVRFAP
jgi:hypothetical protein